MLGYKLVRIDEFLKLKEELEVKKDELKFKDEELKKRLGELSEQYLSKASLYMNLGMTKMENEFYNSIIEKLFDKDFKKAISIVNKTKKLRIKNKKATEILLRVNNEEKIKEFPCRNK
ncbi:hypothetical protein [Clostridioides sp. ZZV15-6598]|uniref:hypothetical protein n=1 Tax=Clostridioides sp. ZZV15-6598 TaxID=2811501 RepID=UPI001D0FE978|nr:hypothetical protein [Clostridioides sp. ZZV15-6598]